jgi:outer membrane protein
MRSTLLVATTLCACGALFAAGGAQAQTPDTASGPVLTLEEAMALATKNNPDHLQVVNNRRVAGADLRSAYGALLPRADATFQSSFRKQGSQLVSGFTGFASGSDVYQSSYYLGLTYNLNAATFLNPRIKSAALNAAEADITGSAETVRALVAQRYFTVLQSEANAALQDSLVTTNQAQLELAKAKLAVGSGTQLDVRRAEVSIGQQQVAAIQAHNQVEVDKLRLFQQMGVKQPPNVRLVSQFAVQQPTFTLDSVLAIARRQNPTLGALRTRDRVASLSVRAAKTQYLPSLQVATGWGGYTNQYSNSNFPVDQARSEALQGLASCLSTDSLRVGVGLPSIAADCRQHYEFTEADARAIRDQNNQFPFDFTKQPFQISATLSLPLFDNFQRELQVEQAQANRNEAQYRIRAQELQLTADVTGAYLTLVAQAKTVALQEQNAAKAKEELRLAQERYRVGAATFLDLSDARASYARAESDRINAIYEYHKAFAALESAVGRPLR